MISLGTVGIDLKKGLWQEELVFVEKKWRDKCICTAVNGDVTLTARDS